MKSSSSRPLKPSNVSPDLDPFSAIIMASTGPVFLLAACPLGWITVVTVGPGLGRLANLPAMRAGHVGSRGECLKDLGASAKRAFRSVPGSRSRACLAQAVQLVVILPWRSHVSAACSFEQYGHISVSLQYLVVWPSFRQFIQRGLFFLPNSVRLLNLP